VRWLKASIIVVQQLRVSLGVHRICYETISGECSTLPQVLVPPGQRHETHILDRRHRSVTKLALRLHQEAKQHKRARASKVR
jgi:hypothetical protein